MEICAVLGHHPEDTPGGAEFQSFLICKELAARGHDTHYVAYNSGAAGTSQEQGVLVHRLSKSDSKIDTVSELRSIDADVYYFRNIHDVPLLSLTRLLADGKTIFNISHDSQCSKILDFSDVRKKQSRVLSTLKQCRGAMNRALLWCPHKLFVQTAHQQETLANNRGIDSEIIGNGHPVPETVGPKSDPPEVLWLASLKRWKHPEHFIEVADRCEDLDCQFTLVGRPSDENLLETVESKVAEIDNLQYLGGCTPAESNELIERASIFVSTSTGEGFPNTFIQSWLRKTPVLSLSFDPDNVLERFDTGRVSGNIDRLESDVRELVENEELRYRMGDAARAYATENHSIELIVDRFEEAI